MAETKSNPEWVVTLRESSEWGSDTWERVFDSEKAAKIYQDEVNRDNNFSSSEVPDYYIVAYDPVRR